MFGKCAVPFFANHSIPKSLTFLDVFILAETVCITHPGAAVGELLVSDGLPGAPRSWRRAKG